MKKRVCAWLLAIAVAVTSVPMTARAAEPVKESTEESQALPQERVGSLEEPKIMKAPASILKQVEVVGEEALIGKNYGSMQYNSAWDTYSSNYIYNQLNSQEKAYWDALDSVCRKYLTQSVNAKVYTLSGGVQVAAATEAVNWAYIGQQRAEELWVMFCYSNPQYYFLDGALTTGTYYIPAFYDAFQSGSARTAATNTVKSKINAWMSQIKTGVTEEDKAKIAHDLIINQVTYDQNFEYINTNPELMDNPYHQSAYSVFADDHTVCAGYAKAFCILMNGAGVDTMCVTSSNHAWNIINLQDTWYHMDCTWDDLDNKNNPVRYRFFGRSYSKMWELGNTMGAHTMEEMYKGVVPACTKDSNSTDDAIGSFYRPRAKTATPVITMSTVNGVVKATITCSTPNAEIYYTTDGTYPTSNFTRCHRYTGAFNVTGTRVYAIAEANGYWISDTVGKEIARYVVTFKSNGGSNVAAQYVVANGTVRKPGNPTRSGYTFAGWYTDSACKTAYNFNTKITANRTLYAKWLKKYTVKFNANKGTVSKKSMSVTYSKKYGTLPTPKRKGYNFTGWYTKKSGGTKITSKSTVKIKKTTTLYAHWQLNVKKTSIKLPVYLVNNGKSLKFTAKKVSGAAGYQIRYSKKSNMKSAKKVNSKTNTIIMKKPKAGVWYFQVRAYKKDSSKKTVYGEWSSSLGLRIP